MPDDKRYIVAKLLYNNETCYCNLPDFEVHRGDLIIIETANGPEIAFVSGIGSLMPEDAEPKTILRQCSDEDRKRQHENENREQEAFEITLEKIKKHGLEMKLVSVHYFLDDQKIIF